MDLSLITPNTSRMADLKLRLYKRPHPYSSCHAKRHFDVIFLTHPPTHLPPIASSVANEKNLSNKPLNVIDKDTPVTSPHVDKKLLRLQFQITEVVLGGLNHVTPIFPVSSCWSFFEIEKNCLAQKKL